MEVKTISFAGWSDEMALCGSTTGFFNFRWLISRNLSVLRTLKFNKLRVKKNKKKKERNNSDTPCAAMALKPKWVWNISWLSKILCWKAEERYSGMNAWVLRGCGEVLPRSELSTESQSQGRF
jgi:hypothetical protein